MVRGRTTWDFWDVFKAAGGGFIQAGITSWGFGCGATGFPGVYTRLSNRGVGNFILSVTGGYR